MKYVIASDIHGSKYYANLLIDAILRENADKVILLGDLYYHGPRNALPRDYDPMQVCEILNSMKEKTIATRGNCDAEVDIKISDFEFKEFIQLDYCGKKIFLSHGQNYNIKNFPDCDFDIMIYGHKHTGFVKQVNDKIIINCGSVSIPKDDTTNSYILIDNGVIYLKSLDGEVIQSVNV